MAQYGLTSQALNASGNAFILKPTGGRSATITGISAADKIYDSFLTITVTRGVVINEAATWHNIAAVENGGSMMQAWNNDGVMDASNYSQMGTFSFGNNLDVQGLQYRFETDEIILIQLTNASPDPTDTMVSINWTESSF